jgi:hypothetical protein
VKRKQPVERKQRKSSRLRGIEAPSIEVNDNDQVDNSNVQVTLGATVSSCDDDEGNNYQTKYLQ